MGLIALDEKEIREMCLNLLETGWPAYLTTVDETGFPQTRAMFNLRNKEQFPKLTPIFNEHRDDFLIMFTTNTSSTKIEEIKLRPKTSVYYCNSDDWQGVMFGGEIEVPTMDGSSHIKVPAGTPSGRVFHLRGKGVPKLGGYGRGDQYVNIFIDVPKKMTPRQKELLCEFAEISGDEISKGFMDKIKDMFHNHHKEAK